MRSMERVSGVIGSASVSTRVRLAMFLAKSPQRSRLEAIFIAATVLRRSLAMGWRRAMRRMALRSMSASSTSSRSSRPTTSSAAAWSRLTTASMASLT